MKLTNTDEYNLNFSNNHNTSKQYLTATFLLTKINNQTHDQIKHTKNGRY